MRKFENDFPFQKPRTGGFGSFTFPPNQVSSEICNFICTNYNFYGSIAQHKQHSFAGKAVG